MDPIAATTIAYAAETVAEGAAVYSLTKATLPLKAHLQHLSTPTPLPRSSHSLTLVGDRAYIFGGELQPRQPVSNDVDILILPALGETSARHESISPKPSVEGQDVPAARVGHTTVAARERLFVFGGRGGSGMTALPENGRLWVFDIQKLEWLFLDPPPNTDYPCSRSYHASTATQDGTAIFIHAGCASTGERLVDTWVFYLDEGRWAKLADAPGPARGGPSLSCAQGKLWRFGGFDGLTELGGQLDYLELPPSHAAGSIISETTPSSERKSEWNSIPFSFEDTEAKSETVPGNRSLAAMHPISTGAGREYLLLGLGEGDPSSSGHAGAGKFWQDLWCYQLPTSAASGAGIKDAIREKLPGTLGNTKGQWARLDVTGMEVGAEEKVGGKWTGRGWFGSCEAKGEGRGGMMVWGGIDESNERLGDGWMVVIE